MNERKTGKQKDGDAIAGERQGNERENVFIKQKQDVLNYDAFL